MDNSSVIIRKANKGDISDIMEIERLSFHSEIIESRNVFEDRIETFQNGFLVAVIGSDIVGYISSELWNYSPNISISNFDLNHSIQKTHQKNGDELYISSIAVNPNIRGEKIGKKLFLTLLKTVQKEHQIKRAILLVNRDWKNAFSMYQKEGFEIIAEIENFFPKTDSSNLKSGTGIIMRKNI